MAHFAAGEFRKKRLVARAEVRVPLGLLRGCHAVVLRCAVAIRLGQLHIATFVLAHLRVVRPVEVPVDLHLVAGQRRAAIFVVIKQRLRLGNLHVIKRSQVA